MFTPVKAYFYQISELSSVQVEIEKNNKKTFISEKDLPITYLNLAQAKEAAVKAGATEGFIVLDRTYEEVDFNNDHDGHANHHKVDLIATPLN